MDVTRWVLGFGARRGHCISSGVCSFPPCSAPSHGTKTLQLYLGLRLDLKEAMELLFRKPTFASLTSEIGLLVFSHDTHILS